MFDLAFWTSGLDLAPASVLFASAFAGSFITVTMGIGGGVLLLAIMASILPPFALIPLHGVIQLGSNATRAVLFGRLAHWPSVVPFLIGAAVGVALGGVILIDLPPPAIQIGVGCFVIWSVLGKPPGWLTRWPWLVGGISTFLSMFFGATGVFVANYVKALGLPRESHTGTHALLMTTQHILKIVTFGLLGFAFSAWAGLLIAMIACGALGTLIGRRVLLAMNDKLFKQALSVILVLISLRLIWQGTTALL